jgi:hypothetical protein
MFMPMLTKSLRTVQTPASLSGVSAAELYANRAAITEGLSTTAASNMNAVVADMEAMGVDMSVYSLD